VGALVKVLGSSPGTTFGDKLQVASLRATRTFLQGVAAAFPTGGVAASALDAGYWKAFGVAVVGAAITALVSFINNVASFLPEDPTQKQP
jgi:hypothetical protein